MLTHYKVFANTEVMNFTSFSIHGQPILGFCDFKIRDEADFLFPHPLFIYVHAGAKIICIDHVNYHLTAGMGILIPPKAFFNCEVLWKDKKLQCINLLLTPEVFSGFSLFLEESDTLFQAVPYPVVVKNDFVREYFNVFIRLVQYENYPPKLLDLKIYELLVLLNAFPTDPLFISGRPDGGSDSKIFSVVTQHLTQNLSLDDLANLAGASMATFKREFRRQFNSSARQWILKQRLDKASRILKYSDRSVKEIAFSCGFNDPSYFIKTFRRSYGYTPDAYRAMQYD